MMRDEPRLIPPGAEDEVRACFPLMRELRPHLVSEDDFVDRWRRQEAAGYRLLVLWENGEPVALAGFRVQEILVHGLHLYVDDLVTRTGRRRAGHGKAIMDALKQEAARLSCRKILLDTPTGNVLGQRFYYREGFALTAFRFMLDRGAA
ncbi:MAG: GNAT family N-acetyltransferase [Rhizobiales bacterium]|nr:GNAT family N-acetyltransferase [Hyphomicrobiales bacterium]OJY06112.1 MAG: GNAT family N-acetyltransferase [Rhizobiales bacterium 63-22]